MEEKGEFERRPEVKPAEQVPLPQKKASPVMGILCGLFAIVAVGLGSYIIYDKFIEPTDTKCVTKTAEEASAADNFAETNKGAKKILQDVINELTTFGTSFGRFQLEKTYDSYVTYEFEKNYATNLNGAYGLVFDVDNNTNYSTTLASSGIIDKVMNSHGLKKISFDDPAVFGGGVIYYADDNGYICNYSSQSSPVHISCANSNWLTEEEKTFAKSLMDAMKKSDDYENDEMLYASATQDDITKTADGKYERVTASVAGAAALFYRNTDGGEWKYFVSTQQVLNCNDFNTDEIKAAFAGSDCYDYAAGKMTTLK